MPEVSPPRNLAMPSLHDIPRAEAAFRSLGVDPGRLRRLRNAFLKKGVPWQVALLDLPQPKRVAAAAAIEPHALELAGRRDSALDGATKLLFRTRAGLLLETVILRPRTGRAALCLSSQVGCAARCVFCATGQMAAVRDLSPEEILDQVVQANQVLRLEGRKARNLVFMGMGEPFHNEEALHAALEVLLDPACFDYAPRRAAVSTVGVPAAMVRCARRFPGVPIALSLHAAREEVRERIVPLAKVHRLPELHAALEELARLGTPVMIECLLLEGVNDSGDDLRALAAYLRGLPVHLNLIPYNPIDGAEGLRGTPEPRRKAFAAGLKAAGFTVTLRYSLGADIGAACGQLAGR